MVFEVEYDANRIASRDNIYIIEAFGGSMTVYKERNWFDFWDADRTTFCYIYRLRIQ